MAGIGSEKTQFKKGNTGRKKGAISARKKAAQMIAETIEDIQKYMHDAGNSTLIADIARLKPRDRVMAHLSIMEYCYPKLARTEIKNTNDKPVINIFGNAILSEIDQPKPTPKPKQIDEISDIEFTE